MIGVAALFIEASVNLGRRGIITMRAGLDPLEWLALALLLIAFVYGEGVRALARKWVPAMVARACELGPASPAAHKALAPLYAMGLVGAERSTIVRAWLGVIAVVAAVLLVRMFAEPWRGIVDLAVAGALVVGLGAIVRAVMRVRSS